MDTEITPRQLDAVLNELELKEPPSAPPLPRVDPRADLLGGSFPSPAVPMDDESFTCTKFRTESSFDTIAALQRHTWLGAERTGATEQQGAHAEKVPRKPNNRMRPKKARVLADPPSDSDDHPIALVRKNGTDIQKIPGAEEAERYPTSPETLPTKPGSA
mmetsp:Transcript_128194/g.356725  ORF Transcript_128194/g.356725 Transcript_128194/m.356725 type:complete len:160 (+) Transcript_128194:365-844(+)